MLGFDDEMRIGKRMKEILKTLNEEKEPMSLTDIIMKIKDMKDYIEDGERLWYQKRVASALGECHIPRVTMGARWLLSFIKYKYGETEQFQYLHDEVNLEDKMIKEANKLYALYSRSLKILYERGLVYTNTRAEGRWWKGNRCLYSLAKKGVDLVSEVT